MAIPNIRVAVITKNIFIAIKILIAKDECRFLLGINFLGLDIFFTPLMCFENHVFSSSPTQGAGSATISFVFLHRTHERSLAG